MARSALAAKRAPARRSCGATARCGRPTRTASSWTCSRWSSWRAPAAIRPSCTRDLTSELGAPVYERIDAPATPEEKAMLESSSPADVRASELAGDPIETLLTTAPGNGAAIGGLKVVTAHGWFAARPSGTEDCLQALRGELSRATMHLRRIQEEAQALVRRAHLPGHVAIVSCKCTKWRDTKPQRQ